MPDSLLPLILAGLAGACLVVQQAINAKLRFGLDSTIWASFASFLVGITAIVLTALILRTPVPAASLVARLPWWTWTGGLLGATFIGLSIILVPQLGAATFIGLVIAGQLLTSVTMDHFGWLGLAQRPIDLTRALGVALLIGGVILIRR
ncbi:DMT family transporter [Rhodoblastus sp.]|uniref:DMT family transporter n=1 Tax=Rhodoblastus sp. TaxID=1962975 RepID=UPI0035B22931